MRNQCPCCCYDIDVDFNGSGTLRRRTVDTVIGLASWFLLTRVHRQRLDCDTMPVTRIAMMTHRQTSKKNDHAKPLARSISI